MKKSDRNCVIFFGSQTGTAEDFAARLAKEARRYTFKAMTADLKDYDGEYLAQLKTIENSIAIFCLATYGEGEPTDNAREFHEWLQGCERDKSVDFTGLRYTVFGLGNKTYEQFNSMARYVDAAIANLGGHRVFERGEGDDDANLEEDFVHWKERMWAEVCVAYNVQAGGDDQSFRQYAMTLPEGLPAEKIFKGELHTINAFANQKRPYNMQNPFLSTVLVNRELYSDPARSCRHIEFDITNSGLRYAAGDHVAVYPINNEDLVLRLARRLRLDLDTVITLTALDETAKKKHPFPCPCTLGTALRHYVDISGRPSSYVVRELTAFTSDPADKERLQRLSQQPAEFTAWVTASERNIVDVLEDIPSAAPPIDYVLELLPRLQPRYYSISSSPKVSQTAIHVTAAIVNHTSSIGRPVHGVATTYLAARQPGDKVAIFVRQSNFRLPVDPKHPVIMIGPGTGFAPFRGFLQERKAAADHGKRVGETLLFFGCQRTTQHFLYQDEIRAFQAANTLTHLSVAGSRDQAQKVYVQHHVREHAENLERLLTAGAYVYVCGDARHMARDVHEALEEVVARGRTRDQVVDFFKNLKAKRRYQADVWS